MRNAQPRKLQVKEYQTWREYLIERFTADKGEAIGYLDVALAEYQIDGATHLFLLALRTVVESQGGITELAKKTGEKPQFFSEVLSNGEAPRLDTLSTILTTLGCRLSIEPLEAASPNVELALEAAVVAPLASEVSNESGNLR